MLPCSPHTWQHFRPPWQEGHFGEGPRGGERLVRMALDPLAKVINSPTSQVVPSPLALPIWGVDAPDRSTTTTACPWPPSFPAPGRAGFLNPWRLLLDESHLMQNSTCYALVVVDGRQWRHLGGNPSRSRNLSFYQCRSKYNHCLARFFKGGVCIDFRAEAEDGSVNSCCRVDKSCLCHGKRQKIRERRPILNPRLGPTLEHFGVTLLLICTRSTSYLSTLTWSSTSLGLGLIKSDKSCSVLLQFLKLHNSYHMFHDWDRNMFSTTENFSQTQCDAAFLGEIGGVGWRRQKMTACHISPVRPRSQLQPPYSSVERGLRPYPAALAQFCLHFVPDFPSRSTLSISDAGERPTMAHNRAG